jgi:hypothetical protein
MGTRGVGFLLGTRCRLLGRAVHDRAPMQAAMDGRDFRSFMETCSEVRYGWRGV